MCQKLNEANCVSGSFLDTTSPFRRQQTSQNGHGLEEHQALDSWTLLQSQQEIQMAFSFLSWFIRSTRKCSPALRACDSVIRLAS
jgi:hypothetical protein